MGTRVEVEQTVPAEPADVYASWTSIDGLARWWWPHIPDTTYYLDARPGGSYRIESSDLGIGVEGDFVALTPPNEVVMTWRWLNDGVAQVEEPVVVRFDSRENETLVTVVHELDDVAGEGDNIRQGWVDVLARLAGVHAQP